MIFSLSDIRPRRRSISAKEPKARLAPLLHLLPSRSLSSQAGTRPSGNSLNVCRILLAAPVAALLAGCAGVIPSSGPSASNVRDVHPEQTGIQVVTITPSVADRVAEMHPAQSFPESFREGGGPRGTVEAGDVLEVMIMEAPPASLFGGGGGSSTSSGLGGGSGSAGAQTVTFPQQYISSSGIIYIPFAGEIHAAGKTVQEIEDDITAKMKAKANQPQVLVREVNNNTNYVTVLGSVSKPTHLALTPARERVLDALTTAAGTAGDVNTYTVQLTRGSRTVTVPLKTIIRNPEQNIVLRGGDVITVMHQPYSFTVMGAMGRNAEVPFEGPYITLAQAMARVSGLSDAQANIRGIFVFRFESPDAVDWPMEPVVRTAGGKVRVIYNLDLSKPDSFFAVKTFPICDGDLVYAAHAPALGLEKILGVIGSVTSPALSGAYDAAATINANP
jgi:polysaccharide export outer membrane protein